MRHRFIKTIFSHEYLVFALSFPHNCNKGMFGCLRVMLQVSTYIPEIEVVEIKVVASCITVFGLKLQMVTRVVEFFEH